MLFTISFYPIFQFICTEQAVIYIIIISLMCVVHPQVITYTCSSHPVCNSDRLYTAVWLCYTPVAGCNSSESASPKKYYVGTS